MRDPLILVVDDQESQRLLTAESLLHSGFSVLESACGVDALKQFETAALDAIVLDVVMPGLSGFEVCSLIRDMPLGKHIPIMMMTARDDDEAITTAFEAGATDFIAKPINPLILKQRMRYMLRSTQAVDAMRRSEMILGHAEQMALTGSWEWDCQDHLLNWTSGLRCLFDLPKKPDVDTLLGVFPQCSQIEELLRCPDNVTLPLVIEHSYAGERFFESRVDRRNHDLTGHTMVSGTVQEVTAQRRSQAEITRLAFFDSLTGLPNRANLVQKLDRMLAKLTAGTNLAVCHIDLDAFKQVNETSTREAGDDVLIQVAERASESLAGLGTSTILARLDGDEFVLVFTVESGDQAMAYAANLMQLLQVPYQTRHRTERLTSSMGVSIYPSDGKDVATLMSKADSALCEAKRRGRNCCLRYVDEIHDRLVRKVAMEIGLRQGIKSGELEVYYQPKVNTALSQVVGMEALVRWQSVDGMVSPAEFIPLAEESDLIQSIGLFVLDTACRQAVDWLAKGLPELEMAVNLSARQLEDDNLATLVGDVLDDTGLPPHLLCLEITEGMMMENHERSIGILAQLKALGCRIAVDDFGTGYSSLSYLQSFPIDILKIDQSFVRDLATSAERHTIVTAIVRMAQTLGLTVVAEGVEEDAQAQILRAMACDEIQGYLYSKPLPAVAYEAWLNNRVSTSTVLSAVSA
jgi:diguanylate cyclase (GGDEF)-like protein